MSDKNRNMNDINDQKTAEQQAFSEEIRRRLAEPGSGKPTLDEFKVMVYKDREKRRKKRNALVACIVAAFIVGFISFDALVPEVGADKNPKETIKTEDGVIIEDGGWGSSDIEDTLIVEDWKYIEHVKDTVPKLPIPKYIPNGYAFNKLTVKTIAERDKICKYIYTNRSNESIEIEVVIADGGEERLYIRDVEEKILSSKGEIYIQGKNTKIATIQVDDGIVINIWSTLSSEEIVRVVDDLAL